MLNISTLATHSDFTKKKKFLYRYCSSQNSCHVRQKSHSARFLAYADTELIIECFSTFSLYTWDFTDTDKDDGPRTNGCPALHRFPQSKQTKMLSKWEPFFRCFRLLVRVVSAHPAVSQSLCFAVSNWHSFVTDQENRKSVLFFLRHRRRVNWTYVLEKRNILPPGSLVCI